MNINEQETQEIRTQELVESYLRDRLPQWFRDVFHERLMDDSELQQQLDLREALEQGLKLEALSGDVERWAPGGGVDDSSTVPAGSTDSDTASRPVWRLGGRVAIAASLFFALTSVLLLSQNIGLRESSSVPAEVGGARVVELFAVRGADPTIVTASEDEPTVLLIDPGLDYETYRVTFARDTDASPAFSLDGQEPEIFDMLAITFPPGTLEAGNYEVVIEGQDAGQTEEIARLMFRVVF